MISLKTTVDTVARPATAPLVIGVFKGYITHPVWFVLTSKISFKRFKKKITLDLPEEFIDSAGFIAHVYTRLKGRIGREKAFELIRVAVLVSGLAVQQASFRNVEDKRCFENLKKYQQRTNTEGITRLNTMQIIEESESRYEYRVTRCLFYELFSYLEVPELTSIMCSIDNAIFNSYLPEKVIFHRNGLNRTIPAGNGYCEFVIENREISA